MPAAITRSVHDERERACAWASLCAFPVDLATLAGAVARSAVGRVRAVRPEFARVCTLFVGLPVSLGQSPSRHRSGCRRRCQC
jgi:hypothetical protein